MKILANSHSAFSRDVSKLSVNGSSHWRDSNPRPEHSGCGKRRPWRPSRPFPNNLIREPPRLQSGPSARSGLLSASRPKAIGLWYQSNLSDCPICTPQYPNLRRAGNRPIPTDLRAVSHGVRVQKQRMNAQQSKFDERADRRSEWRSEKGDLLSNIKWLATQCRSRQSPRKFPGIREFYREFCGSGAQRHELAPRNPCAAATYRAIPYGN